MKYYVIKKGELYYNDIAACFTSFDTVGSLFPPHNVDYIWWRYLNDEDRDSAAVLEVQIHITGIRYIPGQQGYIESDTLELGF